MLSAGSKQAECSPEFMLFWANRSFTPLSCCPCSWSRKGLARSVSRFFTQILTFCGSLYRKDFLGPSSALLSQPTLLLPPSDRLFGLNAFLNTKMAQVWGVCSLPELTVRHIHRKTPTARHCYPLADFVPLSSLLPS